MKRLVLLMFLVSGCATTPKYNCDETCALEGMVCTGMSTGEMSGVSQTFNVIRPSSPVGHSFASASYHCAKDPSQAEKISKIRSNIINREREAEYERKCSGLTDSLNGAYRRVCDNWRAKKLQAQDEASKVPSEP